MVEKTGTDEYKVRRLKHWFKTKYSSTEPRVRVFDEVEEPLRIHILGIAEMVFVSGKEEKYYQ